MVDSYKFRRQGEVLQYFQSWQEAQGSSVAVARNVAGLGQDGQAQPKAETSAPASPDKTLTAFAQLAVFRLNVKRAMVSLIDDSRQMILAEATRNSLRIVRQSGSSKTTHELSVVPQSISGPTQKNIYDSSDLWLGASVLKRADAMCEHCLVNTCTASDSDNEPYSAPGLIVPDCRLDGRFQARSYVQSEPGLVFFAGVPIISRSGYKIGTYSVHDEKPRDGLTVDELQFMQGVAQAVMEHLEWARDRVDRFKNERIVRGMAVFVEDGPDLMDVEILSKGVQTPPDASSSLSPDAADRAAEQINSQLDSGTASPLGFVPGRPSNDATSLEDAEPSHPPKVTGKPQLTEDPMTKTFRRAASILHDSTLADGVVIFGATAASGRRMKFRRAASEEDKQLSPDRSGNPDSGMEHSDSGDQSSEKPCKVLAYSTSPNVRDRTSIKPGSNLSIATLEKYSTLFPRGKNFVFAENGASLSSSGGGLRDQNPSEAPPDSEKRGCGRTEDRDGTVDTKELLKNFPGARVVVFLPLFDYTQGKLAGGCFLWTSIESRMMNLDKHLPYLRAFGSSITSEIGRINAQKNEAAKTTFIASMSHELRSPLHGILGAAEFLKDTNLNSHQSSLVNSVTACGKTLLDTIEHVLDFSKINKLGTTSTKKGKKPDKPLSLASGSTESMNATAVVDLAGLVEEVVDAIAAGYTLKKSPMPKSFKPNKLESRLDSNTTSTDEFEEARTDGMVSVLLDISPNTDWLVRAQPGALRRIVMNLFGNALKYTSSGFVLVSLRGEWKDDRSQVDVVIQVKDTGKGISDDFQKTRLFVPFSQEDSFQPGTGLGLSIVKQIVDSLKGTIEVNSEKRKGTTIDVRLSLEPVARKSSFHSDEKMPDIIERTEGLKLVLLEGETSSKAHINEQARKLEETLAETCSDWFKIDFMKEQESEVKDANFFLYCEPPSMEALEKRLDQNEKTLTENIRVPIIIVCLNAEDAVRISQEQNDILMRLSEIVELIPQPCGPRKLAKVFGRCLDRIERAKREIGKNDSSTTSTRKHNVLDIESDKERNQAVHPYRPKKNVSQHTDSSRSITKVKPGTNHKADEPAQEQSTESEPTQGINTKPTKRDTLHVCVVDDNEVNLKLLVMFMKKCGFTYEEARNGQEAVDKFKEACSSNSSARDPVQGFDAVLMDISMPIMDGFEATKRIRAFERDHKMPPSHIIALTGLASESAQRDAESAGVDYFMPKPVRFAELKKVLSPS